MPFTRFRTQCQFALSAKKQAECPLSPSGPSYFHPQKLNKKEKRNFINDLIRQKQTKLIIDQTEGGIIGKYGIFKNRKQIQSNKIKFVAVQHSSQYTYLKYYRFIKKKHFENSFSGRLKNFIYNNIYLNIKGYEPAYCRKNYSVILLSTTTGSSPFLQEELKNSKKFIQRLLPVN